MEKLDTVLEEYCDAYEDVNGQCCRLVTYDQCSWTLVTDSGVQSGPYDRNQLVDMTQRLRDRANGLD